MSLGPYTGSWDNTDWFAEMYRKNVPSHEEHNISVSGGAERINYYISGAILDQQVSSATDRISSTATISLARYKPTSPIGSISPTTIVGQESSTTVRHT